MNATEQANESPGNRSEWKRILDRLSGNSIFAKSYLAQYVSGIRDQTDVDQRRFRHAWVYRGHPVNYKFLLINDQVRYKDEIRRFLDLSLKKLVELSQELHFRCLFIIIPDKHQLNPSFIKSQAASYGVSLSEIDPQYPDRFLQQELQIYGIPSIDLFPCLENRTGLYYLHDDHFTEAGHRVAAQCVLKPLQDWVANEIVK